MKHRKLTRRDAVVSGLLAGVCAHMGRPIGSAHAQPVAAQSRVLVAYFSRTGNTRLIAGKVRRDFGADLFEIQPVEPYPEDYDATVHQAQQELNPGFEPVLKDKVRNVAGYDTIFLGFPIWSMTAPAVIRSFLSLHDVSGKVLVPFITHGGYGIGQSLSAISKLAPKTHLREGFSLQMDQERDILRRVTRWLGSVDIPR